MHTHNNEPEDYRPEEVDTSLGYERSDVRVTGIVVFLTALTIFVAVTGIVAYGMGKLIHAYLNKEDGPNTKWTKTVQVRELGNMPTNPELQKKVAEMTQAFPTPRVQTDDGNQDVADLHLREDLLLEHYSWVDRGQGTVRIPIERAMALIAARGLPVAQAAEQPRARMVGDGQAAIQTPLTNGFARTGYEQELAAAEAATAQRKQ
jgi:hypothetical protein